MRTIISTVAAAAAIAWITWSEGAAALLPGDLRALVLLMLATVGAAALLARYFDWRGNLRRRVAAERRERVSLERAA